jgi:hypothetical protein
VARGLSAGVSTQLAAFNLDGSIRAVQRALHKGICHALSVVCQAYWRWAALQGIEAEELRGSGRTTRSRSGLDGWLAQVPVLGQRRGSAPATVTALRGLEQGTIERPATTSRRCHTLTRTRS